jgi:hypothetical protein
LKKTDDDDLFLFCANARQLRLPLSARDEGGTMRVVPMRTISGRVFAHDMGYTVLLRPWYEELKPESKVSDCLLLQFSSMAKQMKLPFPDKFEPCQFGFSTIIGGPFNELQNLIDAIIGLEE